ncbi:MAG: hypothetical protein CVV10_06020 [Gammaproteobacteria bacterium HGW-Gammaproteobacteria-14]|nr:MAG: hypothetical protein CVV10_06020 [Gammaproteobacteria bacterium HGW-Gammaproteobacteria-14]
MRLFVINLKRSTARRESAARQLSATGVSFEFFDAIEGSLGYEPFFESYDERAYIINCGRPAKLGEIGCYASHLLLWKKCVELNEPIMIMEDDFQLSDGFAHSVAVCDRLIRRYGYLRLQSERRAQRRTVGEVDGLTLYYYTKVPHSMMCYAVSPETAKGFIERARVLDAPVDVMLKKSWEHRQRMFGLHPYVATESQLSTDTTIVGRVKYKKSLNLQLARFFTKASWHWHAFIFNLGYQPPRSEDVHQLAASGQLMHGSMMERLMLVTFLAVVGVLLS